MRHRVLPPKNGRELADEYFIENRTRLLDIAAFLDRLDRAGGGAEDDFRMRAFRECLGVLSSGDHARTEKIQSILSDPRTEPMDIRDTQNASGAFDHWNG